jgi:methylated-DNA-[protein]-cysteine S-methyltransferase
MKTATEFSRRVTAIVLRIPPGRVITYGEVADAAGRHGAARAVGNLLAGRMPHGAPCHRVIAAAGGLGGYGGNLPLKRALLAQEGVRVRGNRVLDWKERRWTGARVTRSTGRRARTAERD